QVVQSGGVPPPVHICQPQNGIMEAVPPGRVSFLVLRVGRQAVLGSEKSDRRWVDLLVSGQAGKQVVEPGVEILRPQLVWNTRMRVRRDNDDLVLHTTPLAPDGNLTLYNRGAGHQSPAPDFVWQG